jgi:hypothetical protein
LLCPNAKLAGDIGEGLSDLSRSPIVVFANRPTAPRRNERAIHGEANTLVEMGFPHRGSSIFML